MDISAILSTRTKKSFIECKQLLTAICHLRAQKHKTLTSVSLAHSLSLRTILINSTSKKQALVRLQHN